MSSLVPPQEVCRAANNLLDNNDFNVLLSYKAQNLMQEVMQYEQSDEVLEAHREYKALEKLKDWIVYAAENAR